MAPNYDFRCAEGHVFEAWEGYETTSTPCRKCSLSAQRLAVYPHNLPGVNGFAPKPTREHRINVGQAVEAQHEIIHTAEKHGIKPPDFLAIAKERVRRGDAVAID